MQRKYYLLLTAAYVLFLSALYLTPASAFPRTSLPGLDKLVHFSTYGIFSWLMLAALGRCPLRWRSLAPWVFVIAFAHAYWMEFLQGIWPSLNRAPSYYDLAAGAAGALSGIVLRLRYAYKRCNCSASVNFPEKPLQKTYPAHSGSQESPALITHHPKLSGIVAQAFGWKAMQVQSAKGWQLGLICTGKSLVSLPHFSYGALYADCILIRVLQAWNTAVWQKPVKVMLTKWLRGSNCNLTLKHNGKIFHQTSDVRLSGAKAMVLK